MGARPSGRFIVNEPTKLEYCESSGRSDSEAASTLRSYADNLWMHNLLHKVITFSSYAHRVLRDAYGLDCIFILTGMFGFRALELFPSFAFCHSDFRIIEIESVVSVYV